ncbi:MAG: AMP-binding protein [Puniceicoccales bacterium]|jgi:acyl-CoA synthetase (AMP-forming)/AMP-acid ligase II|nr:AMP-binding protein [Puniceicoccales bacterium]
MTAPVHANVSRHLHQAAQANPGFCAVRLPNGRTASDDIRYIERTFAQLDRESDAAAALFAQRGLLPGTKTLLLAHPGLDLILSMFALLKLGAVPVAIDPGMGMNAFLKCVKTTKPEAILGHSLPLAISRFFPGTFASVRTRIVIADKHFVRAIEDLAPKLPPEGRPIFAADGDTPAAILFTSGSTGAPKGVRYTHSMMDAQLNFVRDQYGIMSGEVDLPMLSVFALFNPALGTTTVTPEMNPSRPASVNPEKIVRAILQNNVTYSFGSPAIWAKISRYCKRHSQSLPSMRRVLIAGAPVHPRLLVALRSILPNAEIHTPYGATEVLPVSTISASEILNDTWEKTSRGMGTCVGRPLSGVRVSIIPVHDNPIPNMAEAGTVAPGEIGEIIVQSPSCSREYDNNPKATALAKIPDGNNFWHRMGDLGRIDETGRIWFYGRKVEMVTTPEGPLYTESCEAVFNTHPGVFRSALIGLGTPGHQEPAIVIEPFPENFPKGTKAREKFISDLREIGEKEAHTRKIKLFFFEKHFPVDVRHNAKIHRLTLKKEYERKML